MARPRSDRYRPRRSAVTGSAGGDRFWRVAAGRADRCGAAGCEKPPVGGNCQGFLGGSFCSIRRTHFVAPSLRYCAASLAGNARENRTTADSSGGLRGWPAPGRAPPRLVVVAARTPLLKISAQNQFLARSLWRICGMGLHERLYERLRLDGID